MVKKILLSLFSTKASGAYILLFALAIGVATFIENDFGTSAAQKIVFKSWWFELLLILFGGSILVNIFRFQMIKQKKWSILLFHFSILIILLGAGITRYFGSEGHMYIREGEQANQIVSSEPYIRINIKTANGKSYSVAEPVYFSSMGKNKFDRSYQIGKDVYTIGLKKFIPNPGTLLVENNAGLPSIKLVVTGGNGREEYYIQEGQTMDIHGLVFNFTNQFLPQALNINYSDKSLMIQSPDSLSQFQMTINKRDMLAPGVFNPFLVRTLYTLNNVNFVVADFKPKAIATVESTSKKIKNESVSQLDFTVDLNGEQAELSTLGQSGVEGEYKYIKNEKATVGIAYGSILKKLPFSIRLNDFILDRYPGTNSPASYASEVTLLDNTKNYSHDQRIYMNHVLDYNGYRFFQSSYDRDELGTVLSVNHDAWGTWISYLGYFLLTLGMSITLLSKKSRFQNILLRLKEFRNPALATKAILILVMSFISQNSVLAAPPVTTHIPAIQREFASDLGRLLVQDQNGRIKPVNTLSSELLRKLSRSETFQKFNADQVITGMISFPEVWADMPLIKMGNHEELKKLLNTNSRMVSYNAFFNPQYILEKQVTDAYNRDPRDRSVLEKELIKLDEKVNICNLIFTGQILRLFPDPSDKNNTWISPQEHQANQNLALQVRNDLYIPLLENIRKSSTNNDWNQPLKSVNEINAYQQKNGGSVLVPKSKIDLEIFLNKFNIFSRAGKWYAILGLILLALFFLSVFKQSAASSILLKWTKYGVYIVFILHTLGLAVRWYVSGRAPWSNGYESMIYIAFTTMLSAIIFTRKSSGGLAAGCILASTILMVAGLSWMDPEITPLVPVLKSYWLTIHVSMEAGSYGFLTLGAIIGVLNLLLMIFTNDKNVSKVTKIINELTLTSELILIAGLMIISIGTYLGGVWANESWGRYWGWDAKETWALVTILIYAFILHMRFIPGLRGSYAFNLSSLFGFASVMMTYFGVNYYLSGLHSYAAGDPVPVPTFVYYTVVTLIVIGVLAKWKYSKHFT